MYMAVIDFLPSKALEESIVMHVQSSKFFPKPSELIRLSIDNKQKEDIEPGDKIRNAVRNFGYIQKSKAKEYIGEEIWKIVESYGWSNLCYLNQKEFDFQIFRMDKYIKDVRKSSYNFLVCEKKKLLLEQKNKEIQYETMGLCNE